MTISTSTAALLNLYFELSGAIYVLVSASLKKRSDKNWSDLAADDSGKASLPDQTE